jgi:hypothetical protein
MAAQFSQLMAPIITASKCGKVNLTDNCRVPRPLYVVKGANGTKLFPKVPFFGNFEYVILIF